jgi:Mrp family chromosome partitioning ATPase
VVLVSVADSMVSMIVKKALNMVRRLETPVLGVVQNMAYITCACGETVPLFNDESARQALAEEGLPLLAELPFIRGLEAGNTAADGAMDIVAGRIASAL